MKYNMLLIVVTMSSSLMSSPLLPAPSGNISGLRDASGTPQFFAVDFPELKCGQFAVFSTEISDVAVTAPSYLDCVQEDAQVRIFDSFKDARAYAIEAIVANPSRECVIFDAGRRHVHTLRNGQPIPLEVLLASQPGSPKGWWQIWK